jgi:type III pantothenate kinase
MLLTVDVGNTNTKLGLYDETRLVGSWRVTSRREQTADEYGALLQALLAGVGLAPDVVTGVAISSTVPAVQRALEETMRRYFAVTPLVVEPGVNVPVPMKVEYPREVGPDRVVKIIAGVALYGTPLVIVDLGTATTFECVSPRGEFLGGAIAPGIATAAEALTARAARLFRVDLVRPTHAIGTNTVTNIQSGMVYGYAGLVDGLVDRMKQEMEGAPRVVATGGLVSLIQDISRTIDVVNPHLTLEGLRIFHARHGGGSPPPRAAA